MNGLNVATAAAGLLGAGVGVWVLITGRLPAVNRVEAGRPSRFWRWSGAAWLAGGLFVALFELLITVNQAHAAAALVWIYAVALIVISAMVALAAQRR